VIVNDLKRGTYFARLVLSAENESQQKKIIEIDARRSRFPAPEFSYHQMRKAPGEEPRDRHSFRSNNTARWMNGLLPLAAILWGAHTAAVRSLRLS
jgi:hypothetical protein